MKPKGLPLPAFFPLEDLARQWGCSVDLLHAFSEIGAADGGGRLEVVERSLAGRRVLGVTHLERARFEGLAGKAPRADRPLNKTERESLLGLVGALSILWCGADPDHERHPYRLLADIEQSAAAIGIPMLRGDDTNARLLREGIALLYSLGYASPRVPAEPSPERNPNFGEVPKSSDAILAEAPIMGQMEPDRGDQRCSSVA